MLHIVRGQGESLVHQSAFSLKGCKIVGCDDVAMHVYHALSD